MLVRGVHLLLLAAMISGLSIGCSTPQKNIRFHSRIPSIEAPLFNQHRQLGISTQLESERFEVQATKNLVNDFSFYKGQETFTSNKSSDALSSVQGLDVALTGALQTDSFSFQAEASFDFLELKTGVGALHSDENTKWLGMLGAGYYLTATRVDSGNCRFLCFSSEADQRKNQSIEDSITTSQSGHELKLSATLGYRTSRKSFVYLGYSHMFYNYKAEAIREPNRIEFKEAFEGLGYGVGFAHQINEHFQMSFALQQISIRYGGKKQERGAGVVNFNFGF